MLSQVLVIFVIRTRGGAVFSRPDPRLVWLTLSVAATAAVLPLLPAAGRLGFTPPPASLCGVLAAIVLAYLAAAAAAERLSCGDMGGIPAEDRG
jgi:Mg2+-importing ATPase